MHAGHRARADLASLATVTARTLVLQGDHDEVTPEHGAAGASALPHGRLAVLPGTHTLPVETPDLVNTARVVPRRSRVGAASS